MDKHYTGTSSLEVNINVIGENMQIQAKRHVNTCFFTMVNVDEEHRLTGLSLAIFYAR